MAAKNEKQKIIITLLVIIFLTTAIVASILIFFNSNDTPKRISNNVQTNNIICNFKGDTSEKVDISKSDIKRDELSINTLSEIISASRQRDDDEKEIFRDITRFDAEFIKNCESENYYKASSESQREFEDIYARDINDGNIADKFQELKRKFARTELYPNWKYPDGTIKPLYVDINWETIFFLFSGNGLNNISEKELQKQILSFFNIFFHFYGEKNVLKLLFTLTTISSNIGSTVAVTSTWLDIQLAFMSFGQKIVDINYEYRRGFWSSNKASTVLVHEYAHALDFFLQNSKKNWNQYNSFSRFSIPSQLNSVKNRLSKEKSLEEWNTKYIGSEDEEPTSNLRSYKELGVDSSRLLIDFFADEAKVENPQQKYLLAWSIVNSNYGRIGGKSELFAEAFSQWIVFPRKEKTRNWELLHKFFSKYLPNKANI